MTDHSWVLAVDFGTTNTVAAVQRVGEQPRILHFSGSPLLRSAIYLRENDSWAVGRTAENEALEDPSRFEPTPKRRIGDCSLLLGTRDVSVVDALGAVLYVVVREAMRQHGGRPPQRMVLTHPAQWQKSRTAVLIQAARRVLHTHAGGVELHSLPEPVAAAWNTASEAELPPNCRLGVFDMGGGTLDVALLNRQQSASDQQSFQVVGTPRGLDPLGGEDFDTRLTLWVLGQIDDPDVSARLATPSSPGDRAAALALRNSAREAKEALSESVRAHVYIPRLTPQLPDGQSVQISRQTFEELIRPDLERGAALLRQILHDAPAGPAPAGVFLIGGSSRIPLVGKVIAEAVGLNPVEYGDPATTVAAGAARWISDTQQPQKPHKSYKALPPQSPPAPSSTSGQGDPVKERLSSVRKPVMAVLAVVGAVFLLLVIIDVIRRGAAGSSHAGAASAPAGTSDTISVGPGPVAVAVTRDGYHAYVANRGVALFAWLRITSPASISVIDTRTNDVSTIPLPVGTGPAAVAVTPDGQHAYITNYGHNSVSVIDTGTGTVIAIIPVGARPLGVAITPDGHSAYIINNGSNDVSVIDTISNTVTVTIPVGTRPRSVAVSPDGGSAYIANYGSHSVSVIDTASHAVAPPIAVGEDPDGVAITPDGKRAYVSSFEPLAAPGGSVSVIDTTSKTVTMTIPTTSTHASGVTIAPHGKRAYVTSYGNASSSLLVIDTAGNSIVTTVPLPPDARPEGVAISPDGRHAYTANTNSDNVSVIDTGGS